MFRALERIINSEDGFNRQGIRNIRNTDRHGYNCGGYALGTFSWYCPYAEEEEDTIDWGMGWDTLEEMEEVTDICVRQMLTDFPEMRVIEDISELTAKEYAIAFRVSSDGDFHYIKRNSIGHWYHKRGSCPVIETMTTFDVFNSKWCGRYDGPLVLFAKRIE